MFQIVQSGVILYPAQQRCHNNNGNSVNEGVAWSIPCALQSTSVVEQMVLLRVPNTSLPVGASLRQMGPGSWTELISSTPPLKGTACSNATVPAQSTDLITHANID